MVVFLNRVFPGAAPDARLFLRPGPQVRPFTCSTGVFAAIAGGVFRGEIPDIRSLAGAVLVCLAGILTIRLAGKRRLPEAKLFRH